MSRTCADLAAGANLAAVGQIAAQLFGIFVINELVFVFAIDADPAHGRTKAALLTVAPPVASPAIAGARTARTTRAAALLIFHDLGKLLLKVAAIRG